MKTRRDEGEIWENDHSRKGGQILKAYYSPTKKKVFRHDGELFFTFFFIVGLGM